jgi:4-amino-4-deoxy-L-arabinose transferase-like glycosyltransferase
LFGAVCFVYFDLREYVSRKKALIGSYALGFYVPWLWEMTLLLSESLAIFLVAGFCFFVIKYFRRKRWGYWLGSALFLAWLILTKVIFAYVVSFLLVMAIIFYKFSPAFRRVVLLYLTSLLLCLPYLIYTYSLTGKVFYWANSGGSSLYWMTTPYSNEYGDWKSYETVMSNERLSRHKPFYEKLEGLDYVKQDELLKKQAIANIRRYPLKYCFNWAANLGRIWYAYPYSYKYQRPHTLFYMVPNSILLVSLLFCVYPVIRRRKLLPAELISLIFFVIVYLAASSLISACERFIKPVVPIFIILVAFTVTKLLEVHFRKNDLTL